MSNQGFSPCGRSQLMRGSPPPTPSTSDQNQPGERAPPASTEDDLLADVVATPEIQKWLGSIETILSEVCSTVAEGKMNSDQKLRVTNLCRKVAHGTSQMAILYQSLKQKSIQAYSTIQFLQEQQVVANTLHQFKEVVDKKITQPEATSYANMVKKGTDKFIRPANFSSVAIYPTDKNHSSDETKTLVQKIISPEELKLRVRSLRKIRNGGVIISTDSKDDIAKLKSSEKLVSSGLKIEEPSKRRPKIAIIGVPVALSEKEVLDCIFEQNLSEKLPKTTREAFLETIKMSHKSGKKDRPTCNYILEVPGSQHQKNTGEPRPYFYKWDIMPS